MKPPLVLFICTGNLCRSPMAAVLLRAHAEKAGDALRVESAGTWGVDGQVASPLAVQVMKEHGLDLNEHTARTVTGEMLEKADTVIVMTRSHRDALAAEFPAHRRKLHMMSQLIGLEYDIADPYGRPREAYEACANDLESLIARGYPVLKQWIAQAQSISNA